jgi:antitoxin MazE
MVMEQFKIAKWGNSLAVRLPSKMVKAMGLKQGDLLPKEVLTGGAAIRARLEAKREASKMTREEAIAVMREAQKDFPKGLRPEDWKIDRNDPDMRG